MIKGRKKNIFILSSWYPTKLNPLSGIFVKEQVEALAAYTSDRFNYIVSDWGFLDSELSVRQFRDASQKTKRFIATKPNRFYREKGVYYVENRYLKVSDKFPFFRGFDWMLRVQKKNINRTVEELGPIDLIHAHVSYPAGFAASLLSSELGIPYVLTEHMAPFPFKNYMKNGRPMKEIDSAIENANAVIAVSDMHVERMRTFGYERQISIPNLVNEEIFALSEHDDENRPFQFFTLGFLEPRKGVHDLLKAISIWQPDAGEVRFGIGGDGEERFRLQLMANQLNVSHLIDWYGYVSRKEAAEFMKNCDAFVLPSHEESFGIVYAEAIACGKPVIATACGGPESILNETNGLLVPVSDPESLSMALQKMKDTYSTYDSKAIRKDFENRFSRKAVTSKITDVYESVLAEKV